MQLTPEQKDQVQQAKERAERRVFLQLTPEQKEAYRHAVEQELAGKEENIAHFRKVSLAAEQPGFFGDVRRAILQSRHPITDLANDRRRLAASLRFSSGRSGIAGRRTGPFD
jgi:hypothetical protein